MKTLLEALIVFIALFTSIMIIVSGLILLEEQHFSGLVNTSIISFLISVISAIAYTLGRRL